MAILNFTPSGAKWSVQFLTYAFNKPYLALLFYKQDNKSLDG